MKVSVDKKLCIGCGSCEAVCPKVFVLKDGKAEVKTANTSDPCAQEAADGCPVQAIKIK